MDFRTDLALERSEIIGSAAKGIEMVDDMLRNPLFPEEKFLSEKDVILRECAMYQDSPDSVLYEKLVAEAYQLHPMRHPVIGYREKIETVTRAIMCAYHAKRYTPGRTFYVIAGDVDPDRIMEILNRQAGNWKMGSLAEPFLPQEPPVAAKRETMIRFNDPMTRTACAWQLPPSTHPDIPAIEAFSDIFGIDGTTAATIASGFGGGMARMREVCGTVTAMGMAAGFMSPAIRPKDMKERTANYALVQELADEFRKENGSIICRELLGITAKKEESPAPSQRTPEYYRKRPCPELVACSARIIASRLLQMKESQEADEAAL